MTEPGSVARKNGERPSVAERRYRLYRERVRMWSEYREKEMRISEQERMLDTEEREEES